MNRHASRSRRGNAGGPRRRAGHHLPFWAVLVALVASEVAGCGGGSGGSAATTDAGAGADQTYGLLATKVLGTAQPPVVSAGTGAVITGVAGATFTSIVEANYGPKTLADTKFALYGVPPGSTGRFDLFVMNANGSGVKDITNSPDVVEHSPAWSPDGTKIAFVRGVVGVGTHIYVVNADGTGLKQLTFNSAYDEYSPAWSPDGTRITFGRAQAGQSIQDIWRMGATGGNEFNITRTPDLSERNQSWSPDGSRIVFDRNDDLFTVRTDGTDLQQLTATTGVAEVYAAWSPDGKKIAFTAHGRAGMGNAFPWIESINPDGTGRVELTHPSDAFEDIHPTWSPDSTKIAFKRYSRQEYYHDIFVMNPDGSDLTDITPDSDIAFEQAVWSGYLPRSPQTLVGAGGTLASACAGFLFGQQDKTISSTVTFDTAPADRTKTRVEALTGVTPGVPNLVFGISAGDAALTTLRFVNGYGRVNYVVGGSGGIAPAAGVIVSFSATDGTVTTVIPYSATKAVAGHRPSVTRQGGELVLRGDFTAVIGGNGQRISPSGLHEVRLDARTGERIKTP